MGVTHRIALRGTPTLGRVAVAATLVAFSFTWVPASPASAAACTPTSSPVGSDTLLTFSTVGTCDWTVPAGITSVTVLAVGGGGGGAADVGGGGGGGQVVESIVTVSGVASITVGTGGAAGYNRMYNPTGGGRTGGTSSLVAGAVTVSAKGGSGGIGRIGANNQNADGTANNTGYTGGGGAYQDDSSTKTGSTGTGGAGFKGGDGSGTGGGGGGGAGGPGADASTGAAAGGVGVASTITGSSVFYGGGGGGGGYINTPGAGGNGGGGAGSVNEVDGFNGTNGRGGGGGGAGSNGAATGKGGNGGSGVVIVRYGTPVVTTTTTTTTTTLPATTTSTAPAPTTTVAAAPGTSVALVIDVQAPTTTVAMSGTTVTPVPSTAVPRSAGAGTQPTVSTSTTSTAVASPTTTTARPPDLPSLAAGQAVVSLGGSATEARTERKDNAISVLAGGLAATFSSADPGGASTPLDPEGNIRVSTGDLVRVKMSGFEPGTVVEAWLFSTPVLLGTAKVGDDGRVDETFAIPAGTPEGAHRIALKARTADKKDATIGIGVVVGDWAAEDNMSALLIVGAVCLAVLGALLLPAVSRRRRRQA